MQLVTRVSEVAFRETSHIVDAVVLQETRVVYVVLAAAKALEFLAQDVPWFVEVPRASRTGENVERALAFLFCASLTQLVILFSFWDW